MSNTAAGLERPAKQKSTPRESTKIPRKTPAQEADHRPKSDAYLRRPDLRGYIYLSLMVLFGSTTSPFAMVAVRELPVGILPLLRFSFAGLCLIPFLSDRTALWRLLREDTRRLVSWSRPVACRSTRPSS